MFTLIDEEDEPETGPTLFTLIDEEDVVSGGTFDSDYINVKGFREYVVFLTRTGPDNVGNLSFTLTPSMDGVTDPAFGGGIYAISTAAPTLSPADYVYSRAPQALIPLPHIFLKASVNNPGAAAF